MAINCIALIPNTMYLELVAVQLTSLYISLKRKENQPAQVFLIVCKGDKL